MFNSSSDYVSNKDLSLLTFIPLHPLTMADNRFAFQLREIIPLLGQADPDEDPEAPRLPKTVDYVIRGCSLNKGLQPRYRYLKVLFHK